MENRRLALEGKNKAAAKGASADIARQEEEAKEEEAAGAAFDKVDAEEPVNILESKDEQRLEHITAEGAGQEATAKVGDD